MHRTPARKPALRPAAKRAPAVSRLRWQGLVLALAPLMAALATPGTAGAWLEGKGHGFASASVTYRQAASGTGGAHELSYYGAYGVHPRLTLGVDLNQNARLSGHALLFARLPLRAEGRHRFAAETALGGSHQSGIWQPMQKLTLSYGQGFQTDRFSGWLALDAAYELRQSGSLGIWKLDATLGLNRPGRIAPMLQIETSKPKNGAASVTVSPVLRLPLPQKRELLLGLEYRRNRAAAQWGGPAHGLGLELGLWQKF